MGAASGGGGDSSFDPVGAIMNFLSAPAGSSGGAPSLNAPTSSTSPDIQPAISDPNTPAAAVANEVLQGAAGQDPSGQIRRDQQQPQQTGPTLADLIGQRGQPTGNLFQIGGPTPPAQPQVSAQPPVGYGAGQYTPPEDMTSAQPPTPVAPVQTDQTAGQTTAPYTIPSTGRESETAASAQANLPVTLAEGQQPPPTPPGVDPETGAPILPETTEGAGTKPGETTPPAAPPAAQPPTQQGARAGGIPLQQLAQWAGPLMGYALASMFGRRPAGGPLYPSMYPRGGYYGGPRAGYFPGGPDYMRYARTAPMAPPGGGFPGFGFPGFPPIPMPRPAAPPGAPGGPPARPGATPGTQGSDQPPQPNQPSGADEPLKTSKTDPTPAQSDLPDTKEVPRDQVQPGNTAAGYGAIKGDINLKRPAHYTGKLIMGGQEFDFGTGGGNRPSLPYGKYYLDSGPAGVPPGGIGSRIGSIAGISDSQRGGNTVSFDPKTRDARQGVEIHPVGGNMSTNGCIGIRRDQWAQFQKTFRANQEQGRRMVLDIRPDGARITSESSNAQLGFSRF